MFQTTKQNSFGNLLMERLISSAKDFEISLRVRDIEKCTLGSSVNDNFLQPGCLIKTAIVGGVYPICWTIRAFFVDFILRCRRLNLNS